jgi:hypothetical protein
LFLQSEQPFFSFNRCNCSSALAHSWRCFFDLTINQIITLVLLNNRQYKFEEKINESEKELLYLRKAEKMRELWELKWIEDFKAKNEINTENIKKLEYKLKKMKKDIEQYN